MIIWEEENDMNEYQRMMYLQELSQPTLDDKVKNSLPPAVFGGALGATAGGLIGSEVGKEKLLSVLGGGAGALMGAKKGSESIRKDKSFLGTNAEALGGGVAGNVIGEQAGRLASMPTGFISRRIRKLGSAGGNADYETYQKLHNGRQNRAQKLQADFKSTKGNIDVGYDGAALKQRKSPLEKQMDRRKTAGLLSDGFSFAQDQFKRHGGKVKDFAKKQWENNIKPGLRGKKKKPIGNLVADTVDAGKNFAQNHGHEFKSFAKNQKQKHF